MEKKTALIAGATGLVGNELLQYLLNSETYSSVTVLVRKPMTIKHEKMIEKIIDFDNLSNHQDVFKVDDVYCCLGTTIKNAKTKEAFQKVDVDYPLEMARIAKQNSVEKFLIITSIGANPNSSVFYSRMKGKLEARLMELKLNSLHIFRPSLLLGDRKEFRFGESFAGILLKTIGFALIGPLKKYKPVQAAVVAQAMYKTALTDSKGYFIYTSEKISQI